MRYEVRLLGGLAERAGARRVTVELDAEPTVGRLRDAVGEQHPTLEPMLSRVKVAVDLEVASDEHVVVPGSELALLPPVAGGAGEPPGSSPGAAPGSGAAGDGTATVTARVRDDGRRVLTGLREGDLDAERAVAAITGPEVGGTVTFLGSVRDHAPDLPEQVVRLDYSAYREMAQRVLERLAEDVLSEWPEVRGVALLHALGELAVGAPTVLVVCAAAHRGPAFAACEYALERLKAEVPVFKREVTASGETRWVGLDGC